MSEPARVVLNVYDGRGLLVSNVESQGVLAQGRHSFSWDGKDEAGRAVPPEAYHYTLTAEVADTESITTVS